MDQTKSQTKSLWRQITKPQNPKTPKPQTIGEDHCFLMSVAARPQTGKVQNDEGALGICDLIFLFSKKCPSLKNIKAIALLRKHLISLYSLYQPFRVLCEFFGLAIY